MPHLADPDHIWTPLETLLQFFRYPASTQGMQIDERLRCFVEEWAMMQTGDLIELIEDAAFELGVEAQFGVLRLGTYS